ncbi:Uracil DNA glycosylase superfamily protein [Posidoniimonas polymericola]|uniref:Type-4 uracil-DNA glycosylase n=1 Tax=Posidoniimonas polymericola TaxID=2528002 RepID=A0A5C5YS89_9BACT|nr:UdgX family uracil-DNA binding protein [Posidoniimonas polymericola]TWT77864.1 Uracil DNA glycosylase superfamily protein [Posidoniimonas polymericola]
MYVFPVAGFAEWRDAARGLLMAGATPGEVRFEPPSEQRSLFAEIPPAPLTKSRKVVRTPKEFVKLAERVALHAAPRRFDLLYRLLYRLTHESYQLLDDAIDPDVAEANAMRAAVKRDAHKAKAFVRFHEVPSRSDREAFVAWHRADHQILSIVAPFFSRRFPSMDWTVWTPHESASWDGHELRYGPGAGREQAPADDELIGLWQQYYAAAFNPARKNTKAMKREMPVRYWQSMPETRLLPELLADADRRAAAMVDRGRRLAVTAADFLPADADLDSLRTAAAACRGCELCDIGSRTVFGEGPTDARLMLVGEQPGDEEDLAGRPFVGPAGRALDAALAEAGVDRAGVHLTNTVKHFYHVERGKRRLHKKPAVRHANACAPWLRAEINLVRPAAIVALGATAAQTLVRRDLRVTESRGQWFATAAGFPVLVANHPSAVLRARDERHSEDLRRGLIDDLATAIQFVSQPASTK